MFGVGNWIKQQTTTASTVSLVLTSVTGFDTFVNQFGDSTTNTPGRLFQYTIQDGNNWETGVGHMVNTSTLSRDVVQMTLFNTTTTRYGSPLNLSGGTATVFCDFSSDAGGANYVFNATSTTGGVGAAFQHGSYATQSIAMPNYAYMPFYLPLSGIYSAITWHLSATGSAGIQRFGVYQVGSNGKPSNQLATTGDIVPATGDHNSAFSASVFLREGWHYLAYVANSSTTFNARQVYTTLGGGPAGVDATGQDIMFFFDTATSTVFPPVATAATGSNVPKLPLFSLTRTT